MAGKPIHSWYGFSVGLPPVNTIDANGNVSANYASFVNLTACTASFTTATASNFSVTGNLTVSGNIIGNIVGVLKAPGADGSVLHTIGGNASASANFTFNPSINFLHVSNGNLCVDGTNGGGQIVANYFHGDGSNLTHVSASTAATVTASAQPNITTLGNITSLNISNTGGLQIGNVANVRISGGNVGQTLIANTNGNLMWGYPPQISNGVSSVAISTINGPISISSNGASNIMVVNGPSIGNPTPNVVINGETWANGNVRANYFDGDGSRLSNINSANIVGNLTLSGSFLIAGRGANNKSITISSGKFSLTTRSGSVVIEG